MDVKAEKILLSPRELVEMTGIGRSTVFKMLQDGQIPSFRVGRLRKIPVEGVRAFVEKQLAAQGNGQDER
jgi:excisionase family DNA binding protein